MQLTVIVPSIRPQNLGKLYDSINDSFSGSWEMVVISPHALPEQLKIVSNIKLIIDFGSPTRCQQLGLLAAEGNMIVWAADDGIFLPSALDYGFELLSDDCNIDNKTLVMGKYIEGGDDGDYPMQEDEYYILRTHHSMKFRGVPEGYWMLNVGIVPRKLLLEVGGFDCQYEVLPMSFNDLAIRLQHYGVKFIVQDKVMFKCSHMPGRTGDHGPIHDAQISHDEPLFKQIWKQEGSQGRIKIDLDNWQDSPERWTRRFGG